MNAPHPILFLTSNLGGGGAERALVDILNLIDRKKFQPHLALFQKEGPFLQDLVEDIPIYEIQPKDYGFLHRNWVRVRAIKKLCDQIQPAVMMSMLWQANIVSLLADKILGLNCPLILNEQNTPSQEMQSLWQRFLFWPLAKRTYPRAAEIVVISAGIRTEIEEMFSITGDQIRVIYNPIDSDTIREKASQPLNLPLRHPCLISVGRLAPQKNHSLLLRSFRNVIQNYPAHLYLLGKGPDRAKLEKLASDLGISAYVHFLGFKNNPYGLMQAADILVLSSDYEGFGNVVVEALAVGTPVIATDCPNGPREILSGGKSGLLVSVGDEVGLTRAIIELISSPEKRQRLANNGKKRAKEFDIKKTIHAYESLFTQVIEKRKGF